MSTNCFTRGKTRSPATCPRHASTGRRPHWKCRMSNDEGRRTKDLALIHAAASGRFQAVGRRLISPTTRRLERSESISSVFETEQVRAADGFSADAKDDAGLLPGTSFSAMVKVATAVWPFGSRISFVKVCAGMSLMADYPLGVARAQRLRPCRREEGSETALPQPQRDHRPRQGIGVSGVMLWLAFLGVLRWLGYRGMRQSRSFPALALLLSNDRLQFSDAADSTICDHMLQMFLFLAAFLAVIVASRLHGQQRKSPRLLSV